jgi:hypothetical protein
MKRGMHAAAKALALAATLGLAVPGCVERTITVRSDPPGALVYLDDVERGETPCTFPFNFHGSQSLVLRKDNYEITKQVIDVKAPLYSVFPLDIFFDLLCPFTIKENHAYDVVLQPVTKPDTEKLLLRAKELREQLQPPQ